MVVCLCRGVRDSEIERLRSQGVICVDEVTAKCGAGADCGMCRDTIQELLPATGESALSPHISPSVEELPGTRAL